MPLCVVREAPHGPTMDADGLGTPELVAMALAAVIRPAKSTGRKRRCCGLINGKKQRRRWPETPWGQAMAAAAGN